MKSLFLCGVAVMAMAGCATSSNRTEVVITNAHADSVAYGTTIKFGATASLRSFPVATVHTEFYDVTKKQHKYDTIYGPGPGATKDAVLTYATASAGKDDQPPPSSFESGFAFAWGIMPIVFMARVAATADGTTLLCWTDDNVDRVYVLDARANEGVNFTFPSQPGTSISVKKDYYVEITKTGTVSSGKTADRLTQDQSLFTAIKGVVIQAGGPWVDPH